jgi:hypothetical protein
MQGQLLSKLLVVAAQVVTQVAVEQVAQVVDRVVVAVVEEPVVAEAVMIMELEAGVAQAS